MHKCTHYLSLMPYEINLGQSPSMDRLFVRFSQTAQQLVTTSAQLYSATIYNSVKTCFCASCV